MERNGKNNVENAEVETEESVNEISLGFDGSERRLTGRGSHPRPGRDGYRAGKMAAILARLRTLWVCQANPAAVSRLDGELFLSEAEWAALADSALFAKLRAEHGGGNGGSGAGVPPGFDWPIRNRLARALEEDFDDCPHCAARRFEQCLHARALGHGTS
jgi:hypothetical protein